MGGSVHGDAAAARTGIEPQVARLGETAKTEAGAPRTAACDALAALARQPAADDASKKRADAALDALTAAAARVAFFKDASPAAAADDERTAVADAAYRAPSGKHCRVPGGGL